MLPAVPFVSFTLALAAAQPPAAPAKPLLPAPHPLITEVLFDVPRGDDADADRDGHRSATGDEFIELVNPHRETINLKGYSLYDLTRGKKGAVRFSFPDLPLKPGQVAVVFNGYESKRSFPDKAHTPAPNPDFHGAFVFSMHIDSARAALANAGDTIVLEDPDGRPIHVITWGKTEGEKPKALLTETLKDIEGCSAARKDAASPLVEHTKLARGLFSPGQFPPEDAPGSDPAKGEDRTKSKSKRGDKSTPEKKGP